MVRVHGSHLASPRVWRSTTALSCPTFSRPASPYGTCPPSRHGRRAWASGSSPSNPTTSRGTPAAPGGAAACTCGSPTSASTSSRLRAARTEPSSLPPTTSSSSLNEVTTPGPGRPATPGTRGVANPLRNGTFRKGPGPLTTSVRRSLPGWRRGSAPRPPDSLRGRPTASFWPQPRCGCQPGPGKSCTTQYR